MPNHSVEVMPSRLRRPVTLHVKREASGNRMRGIAPVECDIPRSSALTPDFVGAACFRDAYRAPLRTPPGSVVDLFFGIFGHHPGWMKAALVLRNRIAGLFGLAVARDADVMQPARRACYEVGDTIGPWPVYSISDAELVAGRDNAHLDFRLSVLRELDGSCPCVVVSTVCVAHNGFGKAYLFVIAPLHKWGVKYIISRALRDGRL